MSGRFMVASGADRQFALAIVPDEWADKGLTVKIYDLTHKHKVVPETDGKLWGQFVSSYYLSTLLEHPPGYGLLMYTPEPVWTIPASEWPEIIAWLKEQNDA